MPRSRLTSAAATLVFLAPTALLLPAAGASPGPGRAALPGASPLGGTAAATGIHLAVPVHGVDPLAGVNPVLGKLKLRPDRLRRSSVPGTVDDREDVTVAVGPSGAPASVTDEQHLAIRGAGNYIIRELGPARQAVGLGQTVPPVLELGTVVWQGFSPGRRLLAARLTLDPGIEAARLPLTVRLDFHDRAGHPRALAAGAVAPAAGVVTVTLTNNSTTTLTVQTGQARAATVAGLMQQLVTAARHPRPAVPPAAGQGLPRVVPGQVTGSLALPVTAPLRVTGTLTAPGGAAAISGPGTIPAAGGVAIAGTLSGAVQFTVALAKGDRLGMHLDVRPWLDPRSLGPPKPARSWRRWLSQSPTAASTTAATGTLVAAAATAARAAEYSPYLQADVPGPDLSSFTYVVAPRSVSAAAAHGLRPRPGGITLAAVAVLAIAGNLALLRRRL